MVDVRLAGQKSFRPSIYQVGSFSHRSILISQKIKCKSRKNSFTERGQLTSFSPEQINTLNMIQGTRKRYQKPCLRSVGIKVCIYESRLYYESICWMVCYVIILVGQQSSELQVEQVVEIILRQAEIRRFTSYGL